MDNNDDQPGIPSRPMSDRELHHILIITEYEGLSAEIKLAELLRDFYQGDHQFYTLSVMDAYMKTLMEKPALIIFDIGLFNPIHNELLDKLTAQGLGPVLIHCTDLRLESAAHLKNRPGTFILKKPSTLHELAAKAKEIIFLQDSGPDEGQNRG